MSLMPVMDLPPTVASAYYTPAVLGDGPTGCVVRAREVQSFAAPIETQTIPDVSYLVRYATACLPAAYAAATSAGRMKIFIGFKIHINSTFENGRPASPGPNPSADRVPTMLADIRRLTGWSWDRIGSALERTRQAVHGWTLGKEITQANLERLSKLHATLSYIDRGSADQNRDLLNSNATDGRIVADLLDHQEFDLVRQLLGEGNGSRDVSLWSQLADAERLTINEHWFDRLVENDGSESIPEFISPSDGKRRSITVRRRG